MIKKLLIAFFLAAVPIQPILAISPAHRTILHNHTEWYDSGCIPGTTTNPDPGVNKSAFILGDSIMVRARDVGDIKQKLKDRGWSSTIDAEGSRSMLSKGVGSTNGIQAIDAHKDTDIKTAGAVVIALGTNSSGSADQFADQMRGVIKTVKNNSSATIFWVNIFSHVPQKATYNQKISAVAQAENIKVIDANAVNIDFDPSDLVHPSIPKGTNQYTSELVQTITSGTVATENATTESSCQCVGEAEFDGPLTGNTNAEKAYNFFTLQHHIKPTAAAGLVGNFMWESAGGEEALNTHADNGTHQGIAQWDNDVRWPRLLDFARKKHADPFELQLQLQFVWDEFVHWHYDGALAHAQRTTDPKAAALIIQNEYEVAIGQGTSERQTAAQKVFDKYGGRVADPAPAVSVDEAGDIDIKSVAEKHKLQSAVILKAGGDVLAKYKAQDPPAAPASTMKLVIGDVFLRNASNLDKSVSITNALAYDGNGGGTTTLRNALERMFRVSDNNSANVLMHELGGPDGFTAKANAAGYSGTKVVSYYKDSATGNKSTILDQAKAMDRIFSENGSGYGIAQDALKQAAKDPAQDVYDVNAFANKWGGQSLVAGDVGLFKINGEQFIVGLYYEGSYTTPEAKSAIHNGMVDLIKLIKDRVGSDDCDDAGSTSADAAGIAEMAIRLSWRDGSHGTTPTAAYRKAFEKYNPTAYSLVDCGVFVATVMHASGADKDYPASGTFQQIEYVQSHPDKYDVVDSVRAVSDLRPGDILIVNSGSGDGGAGHTMIYVGKQPPHGFDAASASISGRAANLGPVSLQDSRGQYKRARLK